jgi:hypothetical protein
VNRRDLIVFGAWAAAAAALCAPAWLHGAAFFNHGDLYTYHAPLRHLSASSLQEGRLPFWNPYVLGGVPHLANPQTALFYPATLLSGLFPLVPALTFDQTLHLLWAGLGAFLLGRACGLERGGALVLASAYGLSPFLVYRVTAGIPTLLAALAWSPWVWLAWLRGSAPLLAAAWALQLLSGHGQFLVVNAAGMGLWAALRPRRAELLRRALAGGLAALALTALQWLPTAQFLGLSNRGEWGAALAGSYSLEPRHAASWLLPGFFGTPLDGRWTDATSVFYESAGAYAGLAALALAAWTLARGRGGAALVLAGAGLFLSLGARNPLLAPWLGVFPYLRTPSRWSLLFLWGALLLAGSGARGLLATRPAWARGALALLAFAELARWDAPFLKAQDAAAFLAPRAGMAEQLAGPPARVLVDPSAANLNKTVFYRARGINGYDAFYPAGLAAFAAEVEGAPAADTSRVLISRWPSARLRAEGAVFHLRSSGQLEYDTRPVPLAVFVDAKGAALRPAPKVKEAAPGRWRAYGHPPPGAAALRVGEPGYPGWRARVGGSPVPSVPDGALAQKVPVPPSWPAGSPFRLALDFTPTGWPLLPLLAALAWGVWLRRAAGAAEAAA